MIRKAAILGLYFVLTLASVLAAPAVLRCSECGKVISGRYLKTSDGRVFCSQQCAEARLPRCSHCHKPCTKQIITVDGRTF